MGALFFWFALRGVAESLFVAIIRPLNLFRWWPSFPAFTIIWPVLVGADQNLSTE